VCVKMNGTEETADNSGGSNDEQLRNLMVNYLPNSTTAQSFRDLFSPFGEIEYMKLVTDPYTGMGMGYGFVKYQTPQAASAAISALNGSMLENKTIKVHFAKQQSADPTPEKVNLYVGQLDKNTTKADLEQMFNTYGTVLDAKVLLDALGQSRGIGFVQYRSAAEAQTAINALNNYTPPGTGSPLVVKFSDANDNKRKSRTKGLRYDPMAGGRARAPMVSIPTPPPMPAYPPVSYHYPYQAPPPVPVGPPLPVSPMQMPTHCLFVYNLPAEADDSFLYRTFGPYGGISKVNITRDSATAKSKGYGFVHFMKYEEAQQAVTYLNGAMVENKVLQVSFKAEKRK